MFGHFVTILSVFIVGVICGFNAPDYKDMLIAESGTPSGPLGFIVGYYFRYINTRINALTTLNVSILIHPPK